MWKNNMSYECVFKIWRSKSTSDVSEAATSTINSIFCRKFSMNGFRNCVFTSRTEYLQRCGILKMIVYNTRYQQIIYIRKVSLLNFLACNNFHCKRDKRNIEVSFPGWYTLKHSATHYVKKLVSKNSCYIYSSAIEFV